MFIIPGSILRYKNLYIEPILFVAVIFTLNKPSSSGDPLIIPVSFSINNPSGRFSAW